MMSLSKSRHISWKMAVDNTETESPYNIIVGRDLQAKLGINILYSSKSLKWDGLQVSMRRVTGDVLEKHQKFSASDGTNNLLEPSAKKSEELLYVLLQDIQDDLEEKERGN